MKKAVLAALVGTLAAAIGASTARADSFVFVNSTAINVPDVSQASPYPSQISVSGFTGSVNTATVALSDVSHANARDFDMLLVGPQNQTVLLMSNACQGQSLSHASLSFSPNASAPLPESTACSSGTYLPSVYNTGSCDGAGLPPPAPGGPYGTSLSALTGAAPNGAWRLFVVDTCQADAGTIAGGWALTLDGPLSPEKAATTNKKKKCKKKKAGKKSAASHSAATKTAAASKKKSCKKKKKK